MSISDSTRKQIDRFRLNEDVPSGISLSKVPTIQDYGTLIVSIGGAGADMLLETKGLINQHCCDGMPGNLDKHLVPSLVRYLAFDTDGIYTPSKKSSASTGNVGFDQEEDEIQILEDSGLASLFDPACRSEQKIAHPEIYEWLDTDIDINLIHNLRGTGSGAVRQIGRALLFLNIQKIVDAIDSALFKVLAGHHLSGVNIFLLSGISGGTGGGTCLDLAYILRDRAAKWFGGSVWADDTNDSIQVYGYLLGPDVDLQRASGDPDVKRYLLLNSGAVLQELDHYQKDLRNFHYSCRYSNWFHLDTTHSPFDDVHIISNNRDGIPDWIYKHSIDTVAKTILNFVADAQSTETAMAEFALSSHYCNIANHNSLIGTPYPERSHPYLATGVSSWSIPSDCILKYVFTQMFKSVDHLFANTPSQQDVYDIFEQLGCGSQTIIADMMAGWAEPLPYNYTYAELFRENYQLEHDAMWAINLWKENIEHKFLGLADKFRTNMETRFYNDFINIDRGPMWCNRAMTNGDEDRKALALLLYDEANNTMQDRQDWIITSEKLITEINTLRSLPEPGILSGGIKKKQAYVTQLIDKWNEWAKLQVQIYCAELLLLGSESNDRNGFYLDAQRVVVDFNNQILDTTGDILVSLRDVVRANDTEIAVQARLNQKNNGRFNWHDHSIPRLDLEISRLIHDGGVTDEEIADSFLKELLKAADGWTRDQVDVSLFIENYLERYARNTLNITLEDLLLTQYPNAASLTEAVENELLPSLILDAKPDYISDRPIDHKCYLIIVPGSCHNIFEGARHFCAQYDFGGRAITIVKSAISDRITVISTAYGHSLYDYRIYKECVKVLDTLNLQEIHGLYSYQETDGGRGAMNWLKTPLPCPIPRRYFLQNSLEYPENLKKTELERVARFREAIDKGYPCLEEKREELSGYINYNIWLSADLDQTEFETVTAEKNLVDKYGNWDFDKLRKAIAFLNNWLNDRIPVPSWTHICYYPIVENIAAYFTIDQQRRIAEAQIDAREMVELEEARNLAEEFYLGAYEYYTSLESEIKKYDTVQDKRDELAEILQEE